MGKSLLCFPVFFCLPVLPEFFLLYLLQLDFESLGLSPKGKRFSYQQDPRPHFGVAHSSRSTPFPLWGCEGPLRRQRRVEDGDQMGACPHCHLVLSMDTLRWHEVRPRESAALAAGYHYSFRPNHITIANV